jgi:AcrR family transcriptional regulator
VELSDWTQIYSYILQLEQEGLVTRTFRRLDPERQQAILQAILDEASEKGPAGLNIKEVARRAGVSVGSLYTYFPDREGMLAFAVEICVRFVGDSFDEFRPYLLALPLRQALSAYLLGGLEWSRVYAGLLRLFAWRPQPDAAKSATTSTCKLRPAPSTP